MRAEVHNAKLKGKLEQRLLTVQQCEDMTGISAWTWRRWAYSGKIASVKISTRLLIEVVEVERVIAENRRPRTVAA